MHPAPYLTVIGSGGRSTRRLLRSPSVSSRSFTHRGQIFRTSRCAINPFRVEASRRIGQNYKLTVEGQLFADVDPADPLIFFKNDSFVQVELARYF